MTGPRVAVIVPCFNAAETLEEAVESVPREDVELLVVDDGSTDDATIALLRRLEEQGVRVEWAAHGGVASALNHGLAHSRAPYVAMFAADDKLGDDALEPLADALDASPEVGFAYGEVHTFGITSLRKPPAPVADPWLVTLYYTIAPPVLFRREVLTDAGGWRHGAGLEDWDLLMTVAERGSRGVHVPGSVYWYRQEPGQGLFFSSAASRWDEIYADLRCHHEELFASRGANWRRSQMPLLLKLLLLAVDRAPLIGRLRKTQIAELLTVLLWRRDLQAVREMLGVAARRGFRLIP